MRHAKYNYPDYKRIYNDIIVRKYPEKMEKCRFILEKDRLSSLDIIKLNQLIFKTNDEETMSFNQKHRSYDKATILKFLDYQREYQLNNSQLATHFKLSRNTVARWKKWFF